MNVITLKLPDDLHAALKEPSTCAESPKRRAHEIAQCRPAYLIERQKSTLSGRELIRGILVWADVAKRRYP